MTDTDPPPVGAAVPVAAVYRVAMLDYAGAGTDPASIGYLARPVSEPS